MSRPQFPSKHIRLLPFLLLAALALVVPATIPAEQVPPANPPALAAETAPHQHGPVRDVIHHADGTTTSSNWSGYEVTGAVGSFTNVQGAWTVPAVDCTETLSPADSSFWVGIDTGINGTDLMQTGVEAKCINQNGKQLPQYRGWWEFLPFQPTEQLCPTSFNSFVQAGDQITATLSYDPNTMVPTTTLTDQRNGEKCSNKAFKYTGTISLSSAECIAEAPTIDTKPPKILPLADFQKVTFSACSAEGMPIGDFGSNLIQITMMNMQNLAIKAIPGPPPPENSSSFYVTTFVPIDAPGAGTGNYLGTLPISANKAGLTTGTSTDANNAAHGFTVTPGNTPVPFDASGAGTGNKQGTFALSINTAGAVAGLYTDPKNGYHGFVRAATKPYPITPIDVPGAIPNLDLGTGAVSVNDSGDVTGIYRSGTTVSSVAFTNNVATLTVASNAGFTPGQSFSVYGLTAPNNVQLNGTWTLTSVSGTTIMTVSGGWTPSSATPDSGTATLFLHHGFELVNGMLQQTPIDVGSAGTDMYQGTQPLSINSKGVIIGFWDDSTCMLHDCVHHGFVRAANGAITTFDADVDGCTEGTFPASINTAGTIAGFCVDASGVYHGFIRAAAKPNTITAIDIPGADDEPWLAALSKLAKGIPTQGTGALSINTAGDIAGVYADAKGYHGFVRTAKGVLLYPIDAPGAGMVPMQGTIGVSINDQGYVVGGFVDGSLTVHGFLHYVPYP